MFDDISWMKIDIAHSLVFLYVYVCLVHFAFEKEPATVLH